MVKFSTIISFVLVLLTIASCGKHMTITKAKLVGINKPVLVLYSVSEKSFSDGLSLYRAGELEKATGYFRQAIETDSANWQAHYFLGLIHLEQFDDPAADIALQTALSHAPDDSRERALIYLALGELWEQRGNMLQAKLSYQTALNLHPGSSRAKAGLKRLEQLSQRIEK